MKQSAPPALFLLVLLVSGVAEAASASQNSAAAVSIPTVVWSGVIAAAISLSGVILSNRSSEKRLNDQLRHDAREKHRDRIFALRKEVYLDLTTQMMSTGAHLGSLAAKDPTSADLSGPLQGTMAALAKVQLIGERESSALASQLAGIYGQALFNLLAAAQPMHDLKIDINVANNMYEQQLAQAQRALAEITAENESGDPNPARMKVLRHNFEHYREAYEKYGEDRNSSWEAYNALQKVFMRATMAETTRIGEMQVRLTAAFRNEIGLDADLAALLLSAKASQAQMAKAADEMLTLLEESNHPDDQGR
ncbi:hypothetical protein LVB87_11560 [Lysobacter sp. KIS68-7]|uniref:hypothetical protein n=1 Tax=Lysobacter sp. KIS68-7 TaxID=2904252 RepID=UPI001E5F76B4|nr:hypothetical protein [Lysobacter sp. KIS68-7]UHQ18818.1 hypothetical protein LVB87_11560 [Lysobacter sp. KIS68-7]